MSFIRLESFRYSVSTPKRYQFKNGGSCVDDDESPQGGNSSGIFAQSVKLYVWGQVVAAGRTP
jgi:hypothetical protein